MARVRYVVITKASEKAKEFWRNADVTPCYKHPTKASESIVKYVKGMLGRGLPIRSVFEFGCGTGRTLYELTKAIPEIVVKGIDINPKMIQAGRHFKLDIGLGDENDIPAEPTYDLVFTCSVLDHIPEPQPVLQRLVQASNRFLVILEPWNGQCGSAEGVARQPYSYWWDYDYLLRSVGLSVILKRYVPLAATGLGPHYFLWEASKW